jgi:hypothetical protein
VLGDPHRKIGRLGSFLASRAVESRRVVYRDDPAPAFFFVGPSCIAHPSYGGDTMRHRWILVGALSWLLILPSLAQASTGDVGTIIEKFVVRQFPDSAGHYWVINDTKWDGDEMIVDVHTIVNTRHDTEPTLSRFLLLIVAGELKGSQNIPLEPGAECQTEKDA